MHHVLRTKVRVTSVCFNLSAIYRELQRLVAYMQHIKQLKMVLSLIPVHYTAL